MKMKPEAPQGGDFEVDSGLLTAQDDNGAQLPPPQEEVVVSRDDDGKGYELTSPVSGSSMSSGAGEAVRGESWASEKEP